ncbi:MAG: two-component system nitrate/nitrite response regulator NarL [Myxococcota bacterium]|jgi:two-component system nitrate/nitrite response regulator NarL
MRIVVVAEDRLVLRGLVSLLTDAGLEVDSADAASASDGLGAGTTDAVVVDGIADLVEGPWVALVEDVESAQAARAAGALGVLHRETEGAPLAAALAGVVHGLVVLDPLFAEHVEVEPGPAPGFEPLTPRESEALEHLAMGYSNREIGAELGISERTARFHVAAILEKLGAQSRTEAVVLAARAGLVVL